MSLLTLEVHNKEEKALTTKSGDKQVTLLHQQAYEVGDSIVLKSDVAGIHLVIQLEEAMNPAFVYLASNEYRFVIPFEEKRVAYSPKSFVGDIHIITARYASTEEITAYKNVAQNEYDQFINESCYPHAEANVETRGESVFAARNVINGNKLNFSHGPWPFESWGINQQEDAEITIHFGRVVQIDKIVLTLRADFPHDNYWKNVTLVFSDGESQIIHLEKTDRPQEISIQPKATQSIKLCELIKSDDPSPFPALTQLEAYGVEN